MALPVFCPAGSRGGYQPHGAPPPLRGTPPPPPCTGLPAAGGLVWVCVWGGHSPTAGGQGIPVSCGAGRGPTATSPTLGCRGAPPPPRSVLPSTPVSSSSSPGTSPAQPPPPGWGLGAAQGTQAAGHPPPPPAAGSQPPLSPRSHVRRGGGTPAHPRGELSFTHPPTHPPPRVGRVQGPLTWCPPSPPCWGWGSRGGDRGDPGPRRGRWVPGPGGGARRAAARP